MEGLGMGKGDVPYAREASGYGPGTRRTKAREEGESESKKRRRKNEHETTKNETRSTDKDSLSKCEKNESTGKEGRSRELAEEEGDPYSKCVLEGTGVDFWGMVPKGTKMEPKSVPRGIKQTTLLGSSCKHPF